jgi:tetratricopeptide (TPR) repeat protein
VGDHLGEAHVHSRFGVLHQTLGHLEGAETAYRAALAIYEQYGDRYTEALTLYSIGELDRAEGHQAAAVDAFTQALELCRSVGMPTWESRVRASLEGALHAPDG